MEKYVYTVEIKSLGRTNQVQLTESHLCKTVHSSPIYLLRHLDLVRPPQTDNHTLYLYQVHAFLHQEDYSLENFVVLIVPAFAVALSFYWLSLWMSLYKTVAHSSRIYASKFSKYRQHSSYIQSDDTIHPIRF